MTPRRRLLSAGASLFALGLAMAAGQAAAQTAPATDSAAVAEVVVTGTSIRGIAPVGSPVIGVDTKTIQQSAVRTTADLLASIPQIAQFNQVPTGGQNFGAAVAQVSLRPNLTGATLVLFNGRRLVPEGLLASRTDVSVIPTAAIGRVEVIADGASAIYGSDAVAGVINFVARRNFNGAETAVHGSTASHYTAYDISQLFGHSWSTGSFMLAAEYTGRGELRTKDKSYWSDVGTSSPGLSTSCPVATVGAANPRCDASQIGGDIQPAEWRGSIYANVRQTLSPTIEAWADIDYSSDLRKSQDVQPALPSSTFGATNPFNKSGVNQTIFYRPTTEFGAGLQRKVKFDFVEGATGLDIKLPHDWSGGVFANYGQSQNEAWGAGTNNVAYQQAMLSSNPATAFDPFGHQTSSTVLNNILDGADLSRVTIKLGQVGGKFDGPIFKAPGGLARLAVGGEWRYEALSGFRRVGDANSILPTGTGLLASGNANTSRQVKSIYGEVYFPIVGPDNAIPLIHDFSLSAAARYDDYNDFGGTTNPKIGFSWKVYEDFRLFGNWSTSFQAPNLGDTAGGAIDTRVQVAIGGHPFQPSGGALNVYAGKDGLIIAGGSSGLKPQTSKNYAFGFEFTPKQISGFRATATYYHVDFQNFVGIPAPGTFSTPALQQYGILAPQVNGVVTPLTPSSPQVTQFTSRLPIDGGVLPSQIYWIAVLGRVNLARKVQSGVDFDVSQKFNVGDGSLVARLAGTFINQDLLSGSPGAAFTNVLPTDAQIRYAASLDYNQGPISAGLTFNHLDHRFSSTNQLFRIDNFDLVNLRASYELSGPNMLKGVQLSVNVDNLFDKAPPVQLDAAGGHAGNYWMYGRMFTFGVRKRW